MLSVLIFFLPPLYGEGYTTIETLLAGDDSYKTLMDDSFFYFLKSSWGIIIFALLIILTKVFASSATNGAGGTGGIFAPTLFLGCVVGFLYSFSHNSIGFAGVLPQENFSLFGMAGVMAGVMHAPLTGTFLIAELTGGYDLFLPLMMVSISSYATIILFEKHNIYSTQLAKKGELITHHKDKAVLTFLHIESLLETNLEVVKPDMTLGEMVKVISKCKRNIFPVVNDDGVLVGIILLNDIRNIIFRPELYDRFKVSKLMTNAPAQIKTSMTMEEIMDLFEVTKAWNLPVTDDEGKYKGIMSQSSIFNAYRDVLVEHYSEE